MTKETSFEESLQKLLRAAKEAHDNGNKLQGQEFADERGWLSDEESAEMGRRRARADELSREIDEGVERLAAEHAEQWREFLSDGIALFVALAAGRAKPVDPDRPDARGVEFDRTLAPDLRKAWMELRDGKHSNTARSWALAVGNQILEQYRAQPN